MGFIKSAFGKVIDPAFVLAIVVLYVVLRSAETRNVLGLRTLVTPKMTTAA